MNYTDCVEEVKKYLYLKKSVISFRDNKYLILEVIPFSSNTENLTSHLNEGKSGESFSGNSAKIKLNADFQVGIRCLHLENQNIILLRLKDVEY